MDHKIIEQFVKFPLEAEKDKNGEQVAVKLSKGGVFVLLGDKADILFTRQVLNSLLNQESRDNRPVDFQFFAIISLTAKHKIEMSSRVPAGRDLSYSKRQSHHQCSYVPTAWHPFQS